MSYDINFWRQSDTVELGPEKVLEILDQEQGHPEIEWFTREQVIDAFKSSFPELQETDAGFSWEGEGSYFELYFGFGPDLRVFSLSVRCGYQLVKNSPDTMNLIVDAGNGLGCALYDPQSGRRYQQP
jgi:hypothetical protein